MIAKDSVVRLRREGLPYDGQGSDPNTGIVRCVDIDRQNRPYNVLFNDGFDDWFDLAELVELDKV